MLRGIARANFLRPDWRPCYHGLERLQNPILVARQEKICETIKAMKKNKHKKKSWMFEEL